jgi:DNA-binding MarR family transcriptional regulator
VQVAARGGSFAALGWIGLTPMHIGRTDPSDDTVDRLVSLDDRDVDDLQRILGKLQQCPSEPGRESGGRGLEDKARSLLESRKRRAAIFGATMFAEPAWEMLLILYSSGQGARHTQSNLGELSGASRSTAMRWIEYLTDRELIRREPHPTDLRSNFVSLTDKGRQLLDLYLSETG